MNEATTDNRQPATDEKAESRKQRSKQQATNRRSTMAASRNVPFSRIFSLGALFLLLVASYLSSSETLSYVKFARDSLGGIPYDSSGSIASGDASSTYQHCKRLDSLKIKNLYDQPLSDSEPYESNILKKDVDRILAGDFPTTRFTPHVLSIVNDIDLANVEDRCKWKFYFTVDKPYTKPSNIFCTGMKRSRQVPWACKIFHNVFDPRSYTTSFPPILPSNLTIAISTDDFSDGSKQGYYCLASSSVGGRFTITNFLELQRMADTKVYPSINFTERCTVPIWRGSAWREPGQIDAHNESKILEQVAQKSTRIRAVLYSKDHPDLLDARISNPNNGLLNEKKLWEKNASNGFSKILPIHYIAPEDYYVQYQTALVLCGRGAAFRTPIHLSTGTAVVLQTCTYQEWYLEYMIPWDHYIPLDQDLKNLSATLEWVRGHPLQLEEIAKKGRQFYDEYLSFQRNYDHFYELFYRLAQMSAKRNVTFDPPRR